MAEIEVSSANVEYSPEYIESKYSYQTTDVSSDLGKLICTPRQVDYTFRYLKLILLSYNSFAVFVLLIKRYTNFLIVSQQTLNVVTTLYPRHFNQMMLPQHWVSAGMILYPLVIKISLMSVMLSF